MIVVKSDKIKIVNPVNTIDWGGGWWLFYYRLLASKATTYFPLKLKKNTDSI